MDAILKMKMQLGGGDEPPSMWEELGESPLTRPQRLGGFGGLAVLSLFCFSVAAVCVPHVVAQPHQFAFFLAGANACGMGATLFLVSPSRQLRNVADHNRLFTSVVYILSTVLTLIAATKWRNTVLVIFFLGLQVCALAAYVVSWIPRARRLVGCVLLPLARYVSIAVRGLCRAVSVAGAHALGACTGRCGR
eukprot:TRINITY_DN24593_c0_g1_i1.p2 TRINITY_DN24593_c0_g1~~TRINITY_DN24593_c0_g1_i1.p2  ORF type:complete len:192 (+),score=32.85 TRINITY_DN24593_c0_g1_i1:136-711(+)